jgi:hypothetical protein
VHVAVVVSDNSLLRGDIMPAPTGTPRRPAVRITGAVVRSRRVRLTVAAAQPSSASVELLRNWRRVATFPQTTLPSGRGAVTFDPRRRAGPYEIRVKLAAGAGVAADAVMLVLGRRLAPRVAADALDHAYGDGDESYYYGPYRCRRMRARRVDCEVAEQDLWPPRHVVCSWMAAVTLGRDGLLHKRPYRCPRRGQRLFARIPGITAEPRSYASRRRPGRSAGAARARRDQIAAPPTHEHLCLARMFSKPSARCRNTGSRFRAAGGLSIVGCVSQGPEE